LNQLDSFCLSWKPSWQFGSVRKSVKVRPTSSSLVALPVGAFGVSQ